MILTFALCTYRLAAHLSVTASGTVLSLATLETSVDQPGSLRNALTAGTNGTRERFALFAILTDYRRALVMSDPLVYALLEQKYGKDGADEITALRQQLDQAEARLAEYQESITAFVAENERLRAGLDECEEVSPSAILRKQAEAVEKQAREWNPEEQTYSGRKPHKELIAEAQRLRTQADGLEKTND